MARNSAPQFIWCIRRDAIDFRYLRKDQMVNHYGQNGAFTTKVGLCTNLRNSHWYENVSHETFFPRCYRLSHEEEKGAFTGITLQLTKTTNDIEKFWFLCISSTLGNVPVLRILI